MFLIYMDSHSFEGPGDAHLMKLDGEFRRPGEFTDDIQFAVIDGTTRMQFYGNRELVLHLGFNSCDYSENAKALVWVIENEEKANATFEIIKQATS